ncbi:glycoside hydrolase family 20 protein [Flavobacterium sedimenticola]|uniref:beta-N-acetylhexosaminidase n=1 Tax=Flavobacterium sedimenticola TaxID=3043286 RepID=A0ABT6XNB2_9FLAO|nr:family 20 glycosylhydrolase [Flavobacterium sedimenticola]MDI9256565.1 family 20 glycosylhydrolase [Flavobacterium sedimenticola]
MTSRITFFFVLFCHLTFAQHTLPLIPTPKEIKPGNGFFVLNSETIINADKNSFEAQYLKEVINQEFGLNLEISQKATTSSKISLLTAVPDASKFTNETFYLSVDQNSAEISAVSNHGIFNGIQTLLQLLPIEKASVVKLPIVQIFDTPKYAWRGMHLDCARHFFSIDFIKKYIDYLAMYKFNTFHWHLTDDQGWRIEIKQYPKLTDVGAWRNGSMVGHYNEQKYDTIRYGGFYTQDQIKEVVAYAQQRHITVVPEIEMPGHAVAALAAYPQYSCTGGPFEVEKQWGVLDDVFCPKEETFTFLENILSEVIALFPSEYIHIGGDECPKTRWKSCGHCQGLMKAKGLKDEHELQSYFIQRMEKFVNSKGRKIIGWDEILEGGLAPNAAVMSWRGTEGGIAAAKEKHFVVMTPGSHCYFDHYQGNPQNEPLAIGGYTPVEKVYAFNPIPKELSSEEAQYILGAQANVWTEYIASPEQVEYMIFPRMMALSEVLWGTSNPEKYADFEKRMIQQFTVLEQKGIQYSKALFEITSEVMPKPGGHGVLFLLKSNQSGDSIRYTTDGTQPTAQSKSYDQPLEITKSQTIKATYFENGLAKSNVAEQFFRIHKATSQLVSLQNQPKGSYAKGGGFTLVDGIKGDTAKFGQHWLGFSGTDLIATIDLGSKQKINHLSIGLLSSPSSWIYFPKKVTFQVSEDMIQFKTVGTFSFEEIQKAKGQVELNCKNKNIQFVKVTVENFGTIPDGQPGAGNKAWLFADEITVE